VFIDHPAGKHAVGSPSEFITVDDCETVTRQLQHVLEVENVAYERLEVSSPGLDRPLKKAADYARFAGQDIELTLNAPFMGRRKFQGTLEAGELQAGKAAPSGAVGSDASAAQAEQTPTAWRLVFNDGKVDQALDFSIEEVREARLVPVVDFKGRRFAPVESSATDAIDATAPAKKPGGLDQ
jgi:ribosome maturation factor RimP